MITNLTRLKALFCLLVTLTAGCSHISWKPAGRNAVAQEETPESPACKTLDPFAKAVSAATTAANLAQSARSAQDWDSVILSWMEAIAAMQTVPIYSRKRVFAQKKVREYTNYLEIAQERAASSRQQLPFASFNSQFLNEQLLLYLSYSAALGTPDILIVGSSRALQGIDPQKLQTELSRQGKSGIQVFNFGVNGATAQVVDLIVRQLIPPSQQPQLIIWADGVRAFNSGRPDRTYSGITSSVGYQQLLAGNSPSLPEELIEISPGCPPPPLPSPTPESYTSPQPQRRRLRDFFNPLQQHRAFAAEAREIDANGFLPIEPRFNPVTYYQKFPKVTGRYDADYQNFNLGGEQTVALQRLITHTQEQNIQLVFVNLPLTSDYLDAVRLASEKQFSSFMQQQATQQGFVFVDLGRKWLNQNNYFADPSHLNRFGASVVATQLAANAEIPFPVGDGR